MWYSNALQCAALKRVETHLKIMRDVKQWLGNCNSFWYWIVNMVSQLMSSLTIQHWASLEVCTQREPLDGRHCIIVI